ncbi:MAG: hypothetical protein ACI4QE_05510 [Acutalibacteraceae bacterium]
MDKLKESISKIKGKGNLVTIIMIIGIVGILLIFISSLFDTEQKEEKVDYNSVNEYCDSLQEEVKDIVESIEGAGEVKVLITMENSTEIIYTDDNKEKVKEIEPAIRGVVVVCEGGENSVVYQRILSAVTKSLGVSSNKVCITKLNSEEN